MSILKFKQWLDEVDPYGLQRIIFYKCLFVATIEVYVYWIFLPTSFLAFFSPFFLVSLYEAPVLTSFKRKEQLLIFISIGTILISVSFYLIYPFRGVFLFFSTFVLALTYYYVLKYFYDLKNVTMLLIATGAVILSSETSASFQEVYGLISSTSISMIFALICLRIFPNQYLTVWNKSLQKFIEFLEKDIECAIKEIPMKPTGDEMRHLQMARNYRRLLPKKYLMQAYRVSVNIRNIQLALDNLYYEKKNELFWYEVRDNINWLRQAMKTYSFCNNPKMLIKPETELQHYVFTCLQQAFIRWNKLCYLRQI